MKGVGGLFGWFWVGLGGLSLGFSGHDGPVLVGDDVGVCSRLGVLWGWAGGLNSNWYRLSDSLGPSGASDMSSLVRGCTSKVQEQSASSKEAPLMVCVLLLVLSDARSRSAPQSSQNAFCSAWFFRFKV